MTHDRRGFSQPRVLGNVQNKFNNANDGSRRGSYIDTQLQNRLGPNPNLTLDLIHITRMPTVF